MKWELKEITTGEFFPEVETVLRKSFFSDGFWNEVEYEFNSKEIFEERKDLWNVNIYDFSFIKHKSVKIWDHQLFGNREWLTEHLYKFSTGIKHKCDLDWIYTLDKDENIFNKSIISEIQYGRPKTGRDPYADDFLVKHNLVVLNLLENPWISISIPFKYFINLEISSFPNFYIEQIFKNFIDRSYLRNNVRRILPHYIIKRPLSATEKVDVINNLFKEKCNRHLSLYNNNYKTFCHETNEQ